MQRLFMALVLLGSLMLAPACRADDTAPAGRIVKVLPFRLNLKGHDALSPSLFDQDAYQFYLLQHTNQVSGFRYDVQWKAARVTTNYVDVIIELRGVGADGSPKLKVLAQAETPHRYSHWTSLYLTGADYKKFGSVVAWRASLWSGKQLLDQEQSYLW
jgi:hypothetical protein